MTVTDFKFAKDSSYSDCLTARAFGFAFVVFQEADPSGFNVCVQVFDEEDEEAMEAGIIFEKFDGFRSFGEAFDYCATEAEALSNYVR